MTFRIGIDVGGTFTDLVLWSKDGGLCSEKVLSTPEDPSLGVLAGLASMAESQGLTLEDFAGQIDAIVHGTTVSTNATLTRNGARTGLLTTKGLRDALEMRRGIREEQYNNRYQNVVPLVPRYLRWPVAGRLDYRGLELEPIRSQDVQEALALFRREGVEAVAICFMNAFANPAHEQAVAEQVRRELPKAYLSVSSRVSPTVRFYNRVSTTVLNAYVGPILQGYLEGLTAKLEAVGFGGVLLIMQSNGGVALPEVIRQRPASTLLSGPAAGPCAAAAAVRPHGKENCIVVDMGGTSFDASLVRQGAAAMCHDGEIDRLRISLPMLAITTIGAGGGSIGWTDEGGLLRMGPQSAGALPGPACYGRGGERPTCTDANVVLGYLDPEYFAGGKMTLSAAAARQAIQEHIAVALATDVEAAAAGMYRVINTNMAHGVREITVKRGLDPREFPMVVAGGAGALHACMIADELGIPTLLVPVTASVLCAEGMLRSDLQHDYVRSYVCRFCDLELGRARQLVSEMVAEGMRQLGLEGIAAGESEQQLFLDLRYVKQYHEVTVEVSMHELEEGDLDAFATRFHAEHNRLYGYDLAREGTELELINIRVRVLGRTQKPELVAVAAGGVSPEQARKGTRRAFSPEDQEFLEMPVYDGARLEAANQIAGPALIERPDTTIFISRSYAAEVDGYGSIVMSRRDAADAGRKDG